MDGEQGEEGLQGQPGASTCTAVASDGATSQSQTSPAAPPTSASGERKSGVRDLTGDVSAKP